MSLLCEIKERVGGVRVMRNEVSIEVCEAQEGRTSFTVERMGHSTIPATLIGSMARDPGLTITEILDFSNIEGALLEFEIEVKLLHVLKDLLGSGFVFGRVVREDKEVLHVDGKLSFGNHVPERVGHESLEGGWGIGHAREHDSWFVESMMSHEGGFPLISFLDVDIVVSLV